MHAARCLAVASTLWGLACASGVPPIGLPALPHGIQAISLLGDTLRTPDLPQAIRERYESNLAKAVADYERDADDADAIIWLGRRTAYLGRYRDAVTIYTDGLVKHPSDARLFRHRGHRYITLRLFGWAERDLERAARLVRGRLDEVEPDGIPNARDIPTSTLQSNIWYHLGLARYLQGKFHEALDAYRECLDVSTNPDMLVATSHWMYMTLRRLDRREEAEALLAAIHVDMDVIENQSYHRLLLMYKGEITPDALLARAYAGDALQNATLAYGVGNFHLYGGRPDTAITIFHRILEGPHWAAFGYLATEADVAREALGVGRGK